MLSLLLLFAFYIIHGFGASLILISVLLSAICLVLPIRHSAFDSWPYLALIFAWFVIYNYPIPVELDDPM